jgi:hypothetical protein
VGPPGCVLSLPWRFHSFYFIYGYGLYDSLKFNQNRMDRFRVYGLSEGPVIFAARMFIIVILPPRPVTEKLLNTEGHIHPYRRHSSHFFVLVAGGGIEAQNVWIAQYIDIYTLYLLIRTTDVRSKKFNIGTTLCSCFRNIFYTKSWHVFLYNHICDVMLNLPFPPTGASRSTVFLLVDNSGVYKQP